MMELHGRQSLEKRTAIFQSFGRKEGAVALVCTDIASRDEISGGFVFFQKFNIMLDIYFQT